MPAPLSVVIPTRDSAAALAGLLPDLIEGLAAGLIREVVISDGGSGDDIAALAENTGALFLTGPAGRDAQIERGCAAARGDWLLVLDPASRLPEGWTGVIRQAMEQPARACVFRIGYRAAGLGQRCRARLINLRTRLQRHAHGDQALLVSRVLAQETGASVGAAGKKTLRCALTGRVFALPATVTLPG